MGRHSSPDDGDSEDDLVDALLAAQSTAVGRHAEGTQPAPGPPAGVPPMGPEPSTPEPVFEPGSGLPSAPAATPATPRTHSTAADLALVRHHGDVRARCLAGLLAPFVVYAAVLLAVGESSTAWALWIFAPLVLAGILVGSFLDAGHKRYPAG